MLLKCNSISSSSSFLSYSYLEIVETEQKYVQDLQFIIENYLQELSKIDCPKNIKEKKDFIFSNIEDVFAFHKVLVFFLFKFYFSAFLNLIFYFLKFIFNSINRIWRWIRQIKQNIHKKSTQFWTLYFIFVESTI